MRRCSASLTSSNRASNSRASLAFSSAQQLLNRGSLFGVLLRAANRQFELGADQADAQPFDAKQTQLRRLIGPAQGELLEGLHEEVKVAERRQRRREQPRPQSSEPGRHHYRDEEEKEWRVLPCD